jgi:hypothetical protein
MDYVNVKLILLDTLRIIGSQYDLQNIIESKDGSNTNVFIKNFFGAFLNLLISCMYILYLMERELFVTIFHNENFKLITIAVLIVITGYLLQFYLLGLFYGGKKIFSTDIKSIKKIVYKKNQEFLYLNTKNATKKYHNMAWKLYIIKHVNPILLLIFFAVGLFTYHPDNLTDILFFLTEFFFLIIAFSYSYATHIKILFSTELVATGFKKMEELASLSQCSYKNIYNNEYLISSKREVAYFLNSNSGQIIELRTRTSLFDTTFINVFLNFYDDHIKLLNEMEADPKYKNDFLKHEKDNRDQMVLARRDLESYLN